MRIGVLALQGDFARHRQALARCGAETVEVRKPEELADLDGLVIPGGESTTLLRLMEAWGFVPALQRFHADGKPIFGTCAGLILLAREVEQPRQFSLGFIDVGVERNAYGRQRESFAAGGTAELNGHPVPLEMVFIRAPRILRLGEGVTPLARHGGDPVMARQGNVLVATFHPELTDDPAVHRYFCAMVESAGAPRYHPGREEPGMKTTVNGLATHYTLDGPPGAPVVTLSHSLATDLGMWEPQLADLTVRYRVLRYDTRGHGGTDAPAGPYSLDQLADDARALLEALGIARTHWVGLSMGGMIGQTLALKAPDVIASLALCDTSSRVPPEAGPQWGDRIRTAETRGMEPLVEPTIGRWFTPAFIQKNPGGAVDRVRAMIRATPPAGYVGCCHAISRLDLADHIGAIQVPTLVVVGEEDQGTPVAAARVINERIKGSELVIIKSASHLSNIEQPAEFTRAVTGFLARVA